MVKFKPELQTGIHQRIRHRNGSSAIREIGQCVAFADMLKEKYPGQNVAEKLCFNNAGDNFNGITMGQLVDGVDEFYKDFRNKQLDINWALQYVRDQIKGKPASELESQLTMWRACQSAYLTGDSKKIADACKIAPH